MLTKDQQNFQKDKITRSVLSDLLSTFHSYVLVGKAICKSNNHNFVSLQVRNHSRKVLLVLTQCEAKRKTLEAVSNEENRVRDMCFLIDILSNATIEEHPGWVRRRRLNIRFNSNCCMHHEVHWHHKIQGRMLSYRNGIINRICG